MSYVRVVTEVFTPFVGETEIVSPRNVPAMLEISVK